MTYRICKYITVDIGYSDIGYSDILDIVIILPKIPCPWDYHYIQYVLYVEIENTPKLSEFDIEYCLLNHLVAQMAITGFKICSLWELLYKTRFILRDH